jgi:uncharacterized membrane protein YfcA
MSNELAAIGLILAAAFVAGLVKGITTMGLGLIAVPIIAVFLDVQTAVLSLFASKFLSDVAMLAESKRDLEWRRAFRLAPFIACGALAIPIATYVLANAPGRALSILLALSIIAFVLYQLVPTLPREAPAHERRWGAGFGVAAGASQALLGVGGPFTAMYLYMLRVGTSEFVFLSSIIYMLFDVSQLAAILYFDLYDRTRALYSSATLVPGMAGTWRGIRLRGRMPPKAFKYALLTILSSSAASLLVRGLRG